MPNTKGSIFSIYSTLSTTSCSIFCRGHPVLYFSEEYNVLTSRLVKEHHVLHSFSPSLATSINSNYYKPFKALHGFAHAVLEYIALGKCYASCCMSFYTLLLCYMFHTALAPVL